VVSTATHIVVLALALALAALGNELAPRVATIVTIVSNQ
jgi:hypothetical protein